MSLFIALLPVYLLGNLHCVGMCGPLVLMLGRHRWRNYYFLGRTLSFSLAGAIAGGLGAVLQVFLLQFHIAAAASFLFGGVILIAGIKGLFKIRVPLPSSLYIPLQRLHNSCAVLMLKDTPLHVFLFGFLTIALPCGQTVIVYSACALEGSLGWGVLNGFLFALLTSPSLYLAMKAQNLFGRFKDSYTSALGVCAIIVGGLALCRGFAALGWIPHMVLNPGTSPEYHLALF